MVADCHGREDVISSYDWSAYLPASASSVSGKNTTTSSSSAPHHHHQPKKGRKSSRAGLDKWGDDEDSDETLATVYESRGGVSGRRKRVPVGPYTGGYGGNNGGNGNGGIQGQIHNVDGFEAGIMGMGMGTGGASSSHDHDDALYGMGMGMGGGGGAYAGVGGGKRPRYKV